MERAFSCVYPSALQKLVCLKREVGERIGGDGENILRRGRQGKDGVEERAGGGTRMLMLPYRMRRRRRREREKITFFFAARREAIPWRIVDAKNFDRQADIFGIASEATSFCTRTQVKDESWNQRRQERERGCCDMSIDGEGGREQGEGEGGRRVLYQLKIVIFCRTTIYYSHPIEHFT